MATVGSGEFTYDVLDNWAKTPDGWSIGQAEPACTHKIGCTCSTAETTRS